VDKSPIRVLIVDDYEPWRRFASTTLQKQPEVQVIGEVSDGLEAVQKAEQLRPDLILLDIGLPTLNGIEAARRIREVSPASKILFVSENRSSDIAAEALRTGAGGYIVKSDAAGELLPSVSTVLEGRRFVSASLADHGLIGPPNQYTTDHPHRDNVVTFTQPQNVGITSHHAVGFYTDDGYFLDDVTRFIGAALKAGNAAVVVATESHRHSLLPRLQAYGLDIDQAIEQGRYVAVNAADTISAFTAYNMVDTARFMDAFSNLIQRASESAKGEHPRAAIFGEGTHLLWEQGKADAAIQVEQLCNKLTEIYEVDILCGYSLGNFEVGMDNDVFQRICAEHSAVSSR
jgi:DNA-binding NarL/FixJ family response regulator